MKRLCSILGVLVLCSLLSGCWIKGQGNSVGYITTIETGNVFFQWDIVWFRVETGTMSSMQSQPEAYIIHRLNKELKGTLLETCKEHQKIELIYKQHVFCAGESNDEVIGFNVLERKTSGINFKADSMPNLEGE